MGAVLSEKTTTRVKLSKVAAALVGIGLVISVILLLRGVTVLATWSSGYNARGEFIVDTCSVRSARLAGQVVCGGRLVPDGDPRPLTSVMIGPRAAFGSEVPADSDVVEVYFRRGDTSESYPLEGRTIELGRAVAGVVPIIFLVAGAGTWLAGWFLTRNTTRSDAEDDLYLQRLPQRFALRPRGAAWALFGGLWWLLDRWFVDELLGTVGFG